MTEGVTETDPGWNVLVTAQEGATRDLRRLVNRHGRFRSCGFRNVLLGHVADPHQFLHSLEAELVQKPFANGWLGKALPMAATFAVRPESFLADLEAAVAATVDGLKGKSFHVRVERRGHKGALHTQQLERHLGDHLWALLEARGEQPKVSFRDPDIVIAVEIAGPTAGIAVIPRQLRQDFAFVKVN
jgi:tRNA(Ser,Leu) C12 N-acetylase TAN1